jgi:hypothetical protein
VDCGALFEGMSDNRHLVEVDLSWNNLGRGGLNGEAISNSLQENITLRHLDLSHNGFSTEQAQQISVGLNENHTILGLHMLGNECDVDTKGFVVPRQRP